MLEDLQDQSSNSLVDPIGEATLPLLNMLIYGKASPYLHNGIMCLDDDEFDVRINIILCGHGCVRLYPYAFLSAIIA